MAKRRRHMDRYRKRRFSGQVVDCVSATLCMLAFSSLTWHAVGADSNFRLSATNPWICQLLSSPELRKYDSHKSRTRRSTYSLSAPINRPRHNSRSFTTRVAKHGHGKRHWLVCLHPFRPGYTVTSSQRMSTLLRDYCPDSCFHCIACTQPVYHYSLLCCHLAVFIVQMSI